MRLQSIKLAGFKTFVDSVTIPLAAQRVAVVGPNGCGKSNIIDAVRWVMGESSAKQLRGEAIADVIFNGSSTRKPVGQASIELLFDNKEGRLGGEYAAYSEISIKRQISRDGQSYYYLNGSRCRRRDITDVFLGTGLGPRNYAIIEQGKTRMAEAKPEELRADIEEAAGISKYKERRHETALRIEHTKENLERLNDLRQEMDKQLAHLQKQAQAAHRYTTLKETERKVRSQLFHRRAQLLKTQWDASVVHVDQIEAQFIAANEANVELKTKMQVLREALQKTQMHVNERQAKLHQVDIELTKLNQAQQHQTERKAKLTQEKARAVTALSDAKQQMQVDQTLIEQMELSLVEAKKHRVMCETQSQQAQAEREAIQQITQAWQASWDDFQKIASETQTKVDVESMRISQLESHLDTLTQQIHRLQTEITALQGMSENPQDELGDQWQALAEKITERKANLTTEQAAIFRLQTDNQALNKEIAELDQTLQRLRESYASLDALQQVALGQQNGLSVEWLTHHALADKPRLAQLLTVTPGWERAIEIVLGFYLEAICVENDDHLRSGLSDFPAASLAVMTLSNEMPLLTPNALGLSPLTAKVTSTGSLASLLAGVYCVETLDNAWQLRGQLQPNESLVTADGIWLGRHWLRICRQSDEKMGLIQRERELTALKQQLTALQTQIVDKKTTLNEQQQQQTMLEAQKQVISQDITTLQNQQAQIQGQWQAKKDERERSLARLIQLKEQCAKLVQDEENQSIALQTAKVAYQAATTDLTSQQLTRDRFLNEKTTHALQLTEKTQFAEKTRQATQVAALKVESFTAQLRATEQQVERLVKQTETEQARLAAIENEMSQLLLTEYNTEQLATLGNQQETMEAELRALKEELTTLGQQETEQSQAKIILEQRINTLRDQLEQGRLIQTTTQERLANLQQQMHEIGYLSEEETTLEGIDEMALEKELEQLQSKISRLGAINLAAKDELEEHEARKTYLDAQNTDLVTALDALESAIRQIDTQTRQRFKETFDAINQRFGELFPKLFGGGHAQLTLSESDCLVAGVQVVAHPPGKRNSSIHQLSGGEKALTAIALVFALFELNPAPFCILDEIDAPLDDANIGRFCQLVQAMSANVQFIFITHNKVAMEMAQHLIGVTMNEPGVSRLVAVDVDQAMNWVENETPHTALPTEVLTV